MKQLIKRHSLRHQNKLCRHGHDASLKLDDCEVAWHKAVVPFRFRFGIVNVLAVKAPILVCASLQDLSLKIMEAGVPGSVNAQIKRKATTGLGGGFRQRREKLIYENVSIEIDRL